MLEAKVHSQLKDFLRNQQDMKWVHHLTMARMVARGLRLKRSTIIQTGTEHEEYFPSYITPALLSNSITLIVVDKKQQTALIKDKIPAIQESLNTNVLVDNRYELDFDWQSGQSKLLVIDYHTWLSTILEQSLPFYPTTIIVDAQKLNKVIKEYLTLEITNQQWYQLTTILPKYQHFIRDKLAKLTQLIYAHPPNPYESYLLDEEEINIIHDICHLIKGKQEHPQLNQLIEFHTRLLSHPNYIGYFTLNRHQGSFSLKVAPLDLKSLIKNIWEKNNFIFLANYLEPDKYPLDYSNNLGIDLDNYTCLKFSPSLQNQPLNIYSTKNLPLPNNPYFLSRINQEILALVGGIKINHRPIIVITDDLPLQAQITTTLAANFGSRVKLNHLQIHDNAILVCDLEFWLHHQLQLPSPQLLILPTLPIPSLENPLIAAQVTYYKQRKKDWFRLFLLPHTIRIMQQMTISLRQHEGVLALLDNRVNYRSYGNKILHALEPYYKINYLDLDSAMATADYFD
jgi:ATP-dependent DNA helicase DinG